MRGDRAVSRGRGTTLDGQPSGPRWLDVHRLQRHRWRGQVLRGVLSSRENVVPEELPLGQSLIELSPPGAALRSPGGGGGDKARKGFVGCARRTRP